MRKLFYLSAAAVISVIIFSCGGSDGKGAAANVPEGMALMNSSDCMSCHNPLKTVVGPSFADIAARYPATPDNVNKLVSSIINGEAGTWGSAPMPAHGNIAKADAEKMVHYILSMSGNK